MSTPETENNTQNEPQKKKRGRPFGWKKGDSYISPQKKKTQVKKVDELENDQLNKEEEEIGVSNENGEKEPVRRRRGRPIGWRKKKKENITKDFQLDEIITERRTTRPSRKVHEESVDILQNENKIIPPKKRNHWSKSKTKKVVTFDSVKDWLSSIQLDQYEKNFMDNGFEDFNFLKAHSVSDEELKEIGISLIGHRKRIVHSLDQIIFKQNRSPEVFRFEVHSRQSSGWLSVSLFSEKSKFENSITIFGYKPNNFLQLQNHTTISTKNIFFDATIKDKVYNTIDGIFAFSFKVNATDLENRNFLVLSNNLDETPFMKSNHTIIPRHDSYSSYKYIQWNFTNTQLPICQNALNISGRIYGQHYGGMIFALTMYILLGVGFLKCKDYQPFKSRFVGPFISLGAVYFNLVVEHVYVLIDYETNSRIYCYLTPFLAFALLQLAKIIKKLKLKEPENKEGEDKYANLKKKLNFFLKIISSHWIVLIFPFIWIALFECLQLAMIAYNGFKCTESTFFIQRMIHAGFIGIVFILAIFGLIFDFVCNIPLIIRCEWKKIFIKNDPFNYRLDMLCFLLIIPPSIVWLTANLPSFIFSVIIELIMFIGLYISGLQVFLISLIKWIYHSRQKQKLKNKSKDVFNVDSILKSKILDVFIEYCESEWSSENIFLKLDIIKYKQSKAHERADLTWIIKERYLLVNVSPLEINCPSPILNKALKAITQKNFSDNLFDEIETNVDLNLMDTISRFMFSSLYSACLKDIEDEKKMLGL
eukprot:gene7824-12297_t